MNRRQIREHVRQLLADDIPHNDDCYLYSTKLLNTYINEAQREAVLRSRVLVDSKTPGVCTITVTPNVAEYPLHAAIIVARRIEWQSSQPNARWPLHRTNFDTLDQHQPRWSAHTGQRPHCVVQDLDTRTLRLVPIPTTAATLQLTVWRFPLDAEQLDSDGDEPCIPEHQHLFLAHWVCYRALITKDAELQDTPSAADHLAQFEANFGKRPTAKQLRAMAMDPAGENHAYHF